MIAVQLGRRVYRQHVHLGISVHICIYTGTVSKATSGKLPIGTVSKPALEKLKSRRDGAHVNFSERIDTVLN